MDGSGTTGNPVFDLAVVVLLILIGGFFAASEIALITVRRSRLTQLADEGNNAARTARRLTEDPSRFLATIQIAITFLGFLAGAIGASAFSGYLAALIDDIPIPLIQNAADEIAFVIVTLVIALASIVVGELVPKTMALNFPERLALFVARPIAWLQVVVGPIVWFVSRLSTFLVRLLGGREKPQGGYLSTEELKLLVETGSEEGSIEEEEKEMIHGVIELGDKQVHEVMVPRIGIRAVNIQDPIDEVLDMVVRAGHSRVPVFEDNLDNIVGILYAKDLLPYLKQSAGGNGAIDIREIVRQPVYVPESKPVDDLLHEMQAAKRHMAIVVDEYGGTAGLVTMEDVVEEIVGEIQDEYDSEESSVEEVSTDGEIAFRLDGRVSMDDLRDLFDLSDEDEPDEDAYDTVGGFVVHRVGRIPLPGAEIPFRDDVRMRVEAAEPRRVSRVVASRPRREDEREPDEEQEGPTTVRRPVLTCFLAIAVAGCSVNELVATTEECPAALSLAAWRRMEWPWWSRPSSASSLFAGRRDTSLSKVRNFGYAISPARSSLPRATRSTLAAGLPRGRTVHRVRLCEHRSALGDVSPRSPSGRALRGRACPRGGMAGPRCGEARCRDTGEPRTQRARGPRSPRGWRALRSPGRR